MAERKISYLNKTFDDYRQALIDYTKLYYPELATDIDDASIGSWMLDIAAAVGDNLSYYIDKAYNETNIESAMLRSSVYSLARSNGLKIPGPKGSMTELEFTCTLPTSSVNAPNSPSSLGMPSWEYAPVIRKGTRVQAGNGQYFETDEDVDFTQQFDNSGNSNRTITPLVDSNNRIKAYNVSKTVTATAGISRIYKMVIPSGEIKPFMEVIIPDRNVMGIESIIFKDGSNFQTDPCSAEFMMETEFISADKNSNAQVDTYRFFEVDNLAQPYIWADDTAWNKVSVKWSETNLSGQTSTQIATFYDAVPKKYQFAYYNGSTASSEDGTIPVFSITKGQWRPVTQKFVTEYTDNGYLKVTFGGGNSAGLDKMFDLRETSSGQNFTKNQISHMVYNDYLGKSPVPGSTMFILYRIGGGSTSNVGKGTINTITSLDAVNYTTPDAENSREAAKIISSIRVTNTIPSVAGKDMPTEEEIRAMIKYNNGSLNRCVTVKDYENMVSKMPFKYGCPFRVGAIEENNKVMLYVMMLDSNGRLTDTIPSVLITNMEDYLSMYRSVNDYVEIKPARIINIGFDIDLYIDKNYNVNDVVKNIINTVTGYMDVTKHMLGEDIYVGDIEKEISKVDGVLNLIDMKVYNMFGSDYSQTRISQITTDVTDSDAPSNDVNDISEIVLEASDYILNSEADEMFEIKYPGQDIRVRVKTR